MLVGLAMAGDFHSTVITISQSDWLFVPSCTVMPKKYAGMRMCTIVFIISRWFILKLSAHPTSGGPYFWAAMLSRKKNAPLASWITGVTYSIVLHFCTCSHENTVQKAGLIYSVRSQLQQASVTLAPTSSLPHAHLVTRALYRHLRKRLVGNYCITLSWTVAKD